MRGADLQAVGASRVGGLRQSLGLLLRLMISKLTIEKCSVTAKNHILPLGLIPPIRNLYLLECSEMKDKL